MEKELLLLHSRLKKIDERGFDLNSWKAGTIAVLDSILGPENHKRKLIEDIDFQNNSWSLRDTTGDVDSVKRICADIMETIIMEIEALGIREQDLSAEKKETINESKVISDALHNELSQSQLEDLVNLLKSDNVKKIDIVDKLKRYGYEVAPKIMASILLTPELKKVLKSD